MEEPTSTVPQTPQYGTPAPGTLLPTQVSGSSEKMTLERATDIQAVNPIPTQSTEPIICGNCKKPKGERKEGECMCGHPLKFATVEHLQQQIEAYFKSCWKRKLDMFGKPVKDKETGEQIMVLDRPYTITGLAIFLNTTRDVLIDYSKKDAFSYTIKQAKARIHALWEERLYKPQSVGAIFNLKNNWGWRDKSEVEETKTILYEELTDEQLDAVLADKARKAGLDQDL